MVNGGCVRVWGESVKVIVVIEMGLFCCDCNNNSATKRLSVSESTDLADFVPSFQSPLNWGFTALAHEIH